MTSSLVIDVWGKQPGDEAAGGSGGGREKKLSRVSTTKQLMNEEQNVRGRTSTLAKSEESDERYRMLCEINTQRRRAERNAKKLVRFSLCYFL